MCPVYPEHRNEAVRRFLETAGKPPEGVALVGRWFAVAQYSGVAILEADDPVLVQRLALEWNDLMRMEVSPALTDEQITPLMAAAVER
ncbi:DUF3303 domain-containing protein [Marinobacter lipolyticus]|uniref:DUF3303 domain-containing protein n=1 Tax=Marinobacter lipolyticus TaxID=209639 RepID=UPI003A909F18